MTTASLAGVRQMPGWLKGAIGGALIFGGCWAGAVWYWRANNSTPAAGDLLLSLLALPAALLLAFGIGRKLVAMRAAPPAAAATAEPAQAAAALPSTPPLAILASSLRSPHGASVEELSAAIADNTARADLDQELVDEDGFPVMVARSSDATDEVLQEEITEWLVDNGMAALRFSDEQWRALTMASAVAGELASQAAHDLIPRDGAAPTLQLIPVLPEEWRIEQCRAAGMWLQHTVAQFGWPAVSITLAAPTQTGAVAATPCSIVAELARRALAGDRPMVAMIVACASHIGEASVADWAANASLFTSAQPQGLIPGEGAAGLLLTDLRLAQSIEGAAFALLDRFEETRRETSADDSRRADTALLGDLADKAMKRGATAPLDVAMIVADTGHRASRVLELMGLASSAMPQLDADADVVRVGVASGTCDAVPLVTALALARHHALERCAPVLCISNEHPYHRSTAVIRPSP